MIIKACLAGATGGASPALVRGSHATDEVEIEYAGAGKADVPSGMVRGQNPVMDIE